MDNLSEKGRECLENWLVLKEPAYYRVETVSAVGKTLAGGAAPEGKFDNIQNWSREGRTFDTYAAAEDYYLKSKKTGKEWLAAHPNRLAVGVRMFHVDYSQITHFDSEVFYKKEEEPVPFINDKSFNRDVKSK